MNKEEIRSFIDSIPGKKWYYYYDFGGVSVRKDLKHSKTAGIFNWKKISPIIYRLMSKFDSPRVLDVGCNMGLYDLEMEKQGATVTGIDLDIKYAKFFQKYARENLGYDMTTRFIESDVGHSMPISDAVDIVTVLCAIYHISPRENEFIESLPSHEYLVIQGHTIKLKPTKKRPARPLGGVPAITSLLKKHGYSVKIYEMDGYIKPIVVGEKV